MPRSMMSRHSIAALVSMFLVASTAAFAQFTAGIQGVVQDPSGAGIAKATIQLVNVATGTSAVTTSDASGNYRFVSLAPGNYKVTGEAITVTSEAPVVDTSDSRTQLTLENQAVAQLPIVGRNLVTLVTMAPGVSGLGTSAAGSPASGVDNFSTEEQVDASANGQGQNNNQYVVDGL